MKLSQHKISQATWARVPRRDQLQAIAAELARITSGVKRYGNSDPIVRGAYERCFDLIDLTLEDKKWRPRLRMVFKFRDAIASLYVGKSDPAVVTQAFSTLLLLESNKS